MKRKRLAIAGTLIVVAATSSFSVKRDDKVCPMTTSLALLQDPFQSSPTFWRAHLEDIRPARAASVRGLVVALVYWDVR